MNIGSVRHNENGSISGFIRSLTLDVSIVLRPVTRTNDRSPSFDILARNVRDRFITIGALWEKASKLHGEIYYRGQIDDPSLPEPLQIAAFPQEDGSMNIVFSRPNYQEIGMPLEADRVTSKRVARTGAFLFAFAQAYCVLVLFARARTYGSIYIGYILYLVTVASFIMVVFGTGMQLRPLRPLLPYGVTGAFAGTLLVYILLHAGLVTF